MITYIVRRLLILPITLVGLSVLIFAMLSLLDPVQRAMMYEASPPKTPDALASLIHKHRLDQPIWVQYADWAGNLLHGDLGWSRSSQQPVLQAFGSYFPATLELTIWSFIPMILIGIWLGMLAARHHGRLLDHIVRLGTVVAFSFPSFVLAVGLVLVFYAGLQWLPPGRLSEWARVAASDPAFQHWTGMYTVDGVLNGRLDVALDALRHMLLPMLTLSYGGIAVLARVTRASMLEALQQEYATVAWAKGLSTRAVARRHARPNALIPVTTLGGLTVAGLLSGAGITEIVFDYHGIGWWAVNAAATLDTPAVLAFALLTGLLLVLCNLVVDALYALLDPRIRLQ